MAALDTIREAAAMLAAEAASAAEREAVAVAERAAEEAVTREAAEAAARDLAEERLGVALVRAKLEAWSPDLHTELQAAMAGVGITTNSEIVAGIERCDRDIHAILHRAAWGPFGEAAEHVRLLRGVSRQFEAALHRIATIQSLPALSADSCPGDRAELDAVSPWFAKREGRDLVLRPGVAAVLGLGLDGHRLPPAAGENVVSPNPFRSWLPAPAELLCGAFEPEAWVKGLTADQKAQLLATVLHDAGVAPLLEGVAESAHAVGQAIEAHLLSVRPAVAVPVVFEPPTCSPALAGELVGDMADVPPELREAVSCSTIAERQAVLDRLLSRPVFVDHRRPPDLAALISPEIGPAGGGVVSGSMAQLIDGLSDRGHCNLVIALRAAGARPSVGSLRDWMARLPLRVAQYVDESGSDAATRVGDAVDFAPADRPESWWMLERRISERVRVSWQAAGFGSGI